ncbi:MAG: HAMP domain-containing protein, partial [Candidatus Wildermuthbacteria bacterium]|nr:HAMP domain-containing protein [Candidatus Wildermuthbacteria bacterium]
MKRYSLYTLLFVALGFLGMTISAILYFSINKERNELIAAAVSEKINLAEVINETIFSSAWKFRVSSIPGIENLFIGQIAKAKDVVFVKIVGLNGVIRLSSLEGEVGQTIKDADIQKAATSQGAVVKDVLFGEEKIKLIIYPTQSESVIWVGFSLQNVKGIIVRNTAQGIALWAGSLIFILLVLFFIFRSIINPIKKMIIACRDISGGNLNVKIDVETKNEVGELAKTFNQTIKSLRESREELEEARDVLEIKIKARTVELQNLNDNLEKEVGVRTAEVQE